MSDPQPTPQAEIFNVQQLAAYLGVSDGVVHGLTRHRSHRSKNPIPHLYLGKRLYFRKADVCAWIEAKVVR